MPFEYEVDHAKKRVLARVKGVISRGDALVYQTGLWSRDDVSGYGQLIDLTEVTTIDIEGPVGPLLNTLVAKGSAIKAATQSRLAIVAPHQLAYGIARMFQSYREVNPNFTEPTGVFRTMEEAQAFLDAAPASSTLK